MIIYRPHRGGLKEAMAEAREFLSVDDMKRYVVGQHASLFNAAPFDVDDIVIGDEAVADPRTGWKDTRCVCIKRFLSKDFVSAGLAPQCIGFCATEYNKE